MNVVKGIELAGKAISKGVVKEAPTILTGLAVVGLVSTVGATIKGTLNGVYLYDEERSSRIALNDDTPLTKMDVLKLTWKCYIPAAIFGTLTVISIVSSNTISLRRNAALASAYALTEVAFKEYKDKVVETLGKNKETKLRDSISQDRLEKDPIEAKEVYITGRGETLCYDSLSGRYFKNDLENIRKVINDFNAALIDEMYKPLNDFYHDIGLPDTELGKSLGWNIDYGMLEIHFGAKIATNNVPCIVLEYKIQPRNITY